MALNFRLFNCDRTFKLDNVEALIQKVAKKISREIKIERTYFPLPRMNELCEELEKGDGSHFEYAVFVVHAHESRLSINEKNAGIGYAKVYRALQKVTGDQVLVVIGGDDNYKSQEERDKSVLSRWAWLKICSQFTEEYVNGMKSFIFSWEDNHHLIHEEALEFYLDPTKKGTKFEPRPRPPPVKAPKEDETKKIEQANLEAKRQETRRMEAKKLLERKHSIQDPLNTLAQQEPGSIEKQDLKKEFPPENNKNRNLPPSGPGDAKMYRELQNTSVQHSTDSFQSKSRIADKQCERSVAPFTPFVDVPKQRRFYKASISYGRVVGDFQSDPPHWKPDPRFLNDLLMKHQHVKKGTIELWDEGDGKVKTLVDPVKKKLCKIAEGVSTAERHSIVVYSYHAEEETSNEISKFLHHLGVHELTPGEPIEPQSLITEISYTQPDYLMFSTDADILGDDEVKRGIEQYRDVFKENIQNYVGKGVIIMLFDDMKYTQKGELASEEATRYVGKLTPGIVPPARLTVMSCRDRLYTTHQERMKQALTRSRGAMQSASQGPGSSVPPSKQYYYRAEVQGDQVIEVLKCNPKDWEPNESMMRKKLQEDNDKDRKAYLEIVGDEKGQIVSMVVDKEWKGPSYFARKAYQYFCSSNKQAADKSKFA